MKNQTTAKKVSGDQNAARKEYKVGDTYSRDRFEVHTLAENGKWFVLSRSATTVEEARQHIKERKEWDQNLRSFIDLGKPLGFFGIQLVHVVSTCTIEEIIG